MGTQTKTVKFTTRELRVVREMTPAEFVLSVRGALTSIARELRVCPQSVSKVLHRKKNSRRIRAAIDAWIRRELKRMAA